MSQSKCLEMEAVAMARALDEAASIIGLVDPLDREARMELRLKAYDLLAETRRQAAVNYLASELDEQINKLQPPMESIGGDTSGFFTATTGRKH